MVLEVRSTTALGTLSESVSILETLDSYGAYMAGRKVRPRSRDAYRRDLCAYARWLGDAATVAATTPAMVMRYQESLAHLAPATIGKKLTAIRSWARWCIKVGLRIDDPTLAVEWPERDEPIARALSSAELTRLEWWLDRPLPLLDVRGARMLARDKLAVLLMLYAGLRLAECAGLTWRLVDLEAGMLTISRETAKGGRPRAIALHDRLSAALRAVPPSMRHGAVVGHKDGRCLRAKSLAHTFERRLREDAGLEITAHELRHTCATQLLWAGANIREIQRLLGHKRLSTTERYLQLDLAQQRKAVALLPDRFTTR